MRSSFNFRLHPFISMASEVVKRKDEEEDKDKEKKPEIETYSVDREKVEQLINKRFKSNHQIYNQYTDMSISFESVL